MEKSNEKKEVKKHMVIIYNIIADLFILYIFVHFAAFFAVMIASRRKRKKYLKNNVFINGSFSSNLPAERDSFFRRQYRKLDPFASGLTKYVSIQISKIPSNSIRCWMVKRILASGVSRNTVIYHGAIFRGAPKIDIGQGTVIGDDCLLDGRGGLTIGENCNLSTGVKIWTAQHDMNSPDFAYEDAEVKIGNRCWISGGVTILPGVTIGEGCVIASAAVVTKNCEPFGIYAGIPAKRIGERNQDLRYVFDGKHDWFM